MKAKKIVFMGNSESGKTSIAHRLIPPGGMYLVMGPSSLDKHGKLQPTIGVEVTQFCAPSGQVYNIWDTAGLKKFEGLGPAYGIEADLILLFVGGEGRTLQDWEESIRHFFSEETKKPCPPIQWIDGQDLDAKEAQVRSLLM